jgi:hypothetical protein
MEASWTQLWMISSATKMDRFVWRQTLAIAMFLKRELALDLLTALDRF